MAFKTQEIRFQTKKKFKISRESMPTDPLEASRLRRSVVPPSIPRLATPLRSELNLNVTFQWKLFVKELFQINALELFLLYLDMNEWSMLCCFYTQTREHEGQRGTLPVHAL